MCRKAAVDKAAKFPALPKDLPHGLKQLDDSELVSLLAAAFDEAKRRDRLRPGLVASAEVGDPKGSPLRTIRSQETTAVGMI